MQSSPLGRRRFLLAGAATVAAAACGGSTGGAATTTTTEADADAELLVAAYFPPDQIVAGAPMRLPLGFATNDGPLDDVARTVDFTLSSRGAREVTGSATSHRKGLPRPYYPVEFTVPKPGQWTLTLDDGERRARTTLLVQNAASPRSPLVPRVGEPLPSLDTPTSTDQRGVKPICTADPPCPFHAVNLADALRDRKQVALLVSTPAFCKVEVCGPVLDLVEQADRPDDLVVIHAEVYQDPYGDRPDAQSPSDQLGPTTDVIGRLNMTYEPSLFVAGADGVISARLDTIFDATEIAKAFTAS